MLVRRVCRARRCEVETTSGGTCGAVEHVVKKGLFRGTPAYIVAIIVLACALPLSIMVAVTFGTIKLGVGDVYRVLLSSPFADSGVSPLHDVVWLIRLPRLVLGAAVGMALAVCGVVMQAIVKNPLADPYILGVSSGASLGATLAIVLGVGAFFGANAVGIMGFLGAFLASLAVLGISSIGGRSNSIKLLLAGLAVGAMAGAFSNFVIYLASDNATKQVVNWTMGSLAGAKWTTNCVVAVVTIIGVAFLWTQYRTLNLMLLGDDTAITLGTDLRRWRIGYLVVTSLMMGFAVYAAGMIGFVGLVIPHICRMLFGTDHKKLIPISALAGAVFLVWADVACRVVLTGQELPIGVLTSIIGAPVFVYLMAHKRYGFGQGE